MARLTELRRSTLAPLLGILFAAVIAFAIYINGAIRSIEQDLPQALLEQVRDIALTVQDLADLLHALETGPPGTAAVSALHARLSERIQAIRSTYTLDNMVHVSAVHATVAPVLFDTKRWLAEGISGYPPQSRMVVRLVRQRLSDAYEKTKNLYVLSDAAARTELNRQRQRLEYFLIGVNLTLAAAAILAICLAGLLLRHDVVTRRHRSTEATLRKLSQVVEQSPAAVIICDPTGRIDYVNQKFIEVTGRDFDSLFGQQEPLLLASPLMTQENFAEIWNAIIDGGTWRGEVANARPDGNVFWESAVISSIRGTDGAISHFVSVKEDITLRKEYQQKLEYQTNHDKLTGLPNRVLLLDRLGQALVGLRRSGQRLALILLDFDHFKRVVDGIGHPASDLVLCQAARRLRETVAEPCTVARLGGDEFAVVVSGLEDAVEVEAVATDILESFTRPYHHDGHEVFLTASLGIAVAPEDGVDPNGLMRKADAAMYRAKGAGRNAFRFFTPELDAQARALIRMESCLHRAVERDEFALHYQPILDARTLRPVRLEGLLRWHHRDLGQVPPDQFIGLAEDSGLILPIGAWVLTTGCRQVAHWRRALGVPIGLAVNVSYRQFRDPGFAALVVRTLEATGLPAADLELEITERVLMADQPETSATLEALTMLGVRLSVDDFGTGYSSLSYLHRFPIHGLKIDRSFVHGLPGRSRSGLVAAIIGIGHSLGLSVTAEGVETESELAFLRERGCDLVQGYLLSAPMASERAETFLRANVGAALVPA